MLRDHLYHNVAASTLDQMIKRVSSPKRWNFILTNPEKVTTEELIILHEELQIAFSELFSMGVGTLLSETERNFFTNTYNEQRVPHTKESLTHHPAHAGRQPAAV